MYKLSKDYFFSPSDLTLFMDSPFASWMERYSIEYPQVVFKKDLADALLGSLQQKGFAHEDQLENDFRKQGLSVTKITGSTIESKYNDTLSAMKQGIDVIVQARLEKGRFAGFADFLVKIPGVSDLGDYHYEVWDTKLTKHLKPTHIIQLCCYSEMLETIQGRLPNNITVALGNGEVKPLKIRNYFNYYLGLKNNFTSFQNNFDLNNMPDPADYKSWGDWSNYAGELLKERDHLFQVATITRSQIKKLNKANILTMSQLIETNIEYVPGINRSVFKNLKKQATIQKVSYGMDKPHYEILSHQEGEKKGLALLPPASPLDVFFDIEGFPLLDGGLEYLWGCTYFNELGHRDFLDFWAHDREQEKEAFKNFILWVYDRWKRDPNMHIYHYANYEIAACRKLMGRFGVCENEVDQLLRNEVFVDLYKVVKGGILLGEPRYSIKNVELLYRGKRNTEVGSGGDSVVLYEQWTELFAKGKESNSWKDSKILKDIRDYNIDDCESTQELVDWLRERQKEHDIVYLGKTKSYEPEVSEKITETIKLRERLLIKAKQLLTSNPEKAALLENLASMLEFHRRESKPVFWRMFDRLGYSPEELMDDSDCLANCQRTIRESFKPTAKARKLAYEYSFDPSQEFKGTANSFFLLGEENEKGYPYEVTYVAEKNDIENGLIVVQSNLEPKAVISLIPNEIVRPKPIPEAIYNVAFEYEADKLPRCAILDFLNRSTPVIKGQHVGSIAPSKNPEEKLEQIINAIKNLDNSYLTIQGPPGSGKTYTATHAIAELVKEGFKVGISSNSHKAINHLLLSTAKYCNENGIKASFACTKETEAALRDEGISIIKNNELINHVKGSCVIGTTAWGFARDDMVNKLDYLFVDEAGQVAVANLVAMSRSAKNLVLMGDQMQLGQPTQGSHPVDSGLSILDYLLHDSPTIPDEIGVFLGTSYRMHRSINSFISEYIYEGKLESHLDNDQRVIEIPSGYKGKLNKEAGIVYVPVHHEGNTQASEEEITEIKKMTTELLGRTFRGNNGHKRKIDWSDILFIAPYNHQVQKLKQSLGDHARVGTIDKFQGQEAPVVFLSMCASDVNESPRGLEFLLDRHRINVAISRAQSLAIVVSHPGIGNTRTNCIQKLASINLFQALSNT